MCSDSSQQLNLQPSDAALPVCRWLTRTRREHVQLISGLQTDLNEYLPLQALLAPVLFLPADYLTASSSVWAPPGCQSPLCLTTSMIRVPIPVVTVPSTLITICL